MINCKLHVNIDVIIRDVHTKCIISVDWAALAQQWIKMKETVVPPAPPPPLIIDSTQTSSDGGGEAPMDMDTKEDEVPPAPPAPNISGSGCYTRYVCRLQIYLIYWCKLLRRGMFQI